MLDAVMLKADELSDRYGHEALKEAEMLLSEATAGRDYRAGIFYADVCGELRERIPLLQLERNSWHRLKRLLGFSGCRDLNELMMR